ncbi:hypothetical protein MVLG_03424 [Microbotryum lychnidis-dioicae p1A1 Lamole]|uniref:Uncharacterized protein n=1 Tax=Microbotryum lychnidis-dioicae (strain p1A1 Lamole / MvSl-1064) TaxID=683840 RepID=U5H857_USTV1|nr:hypothetical protein MVLG_03424 [Microbotryum lychnidis-dioicae p1A1 Lamole]|eukprot:KDE06265.1 hypothetical protein MVLG_03424 [Microbotryum lychnidis-dioicae p1A1 Lamole]
MFLCIPIVYGCPSKLTQEGHEQIICPRCHNSGTRQYKQKKWFELCYVPLIPLGSKQVYMCPICQWRAPVENVNVDELSSGKGQTQYGVPAAPPTSNSRGYDVAYSTPTAK